MWCSVTPNSWGWEREWKCDCFLIVKLLLMQKDNFNVSIGKCVLTSVLEAAICGCVCACLLWLSHPLGRVKPLDFMEDTKLFSHQAAQVISPKFGSYWTHYVSWHAWLEASGFFCCLLLLMFLMRRAQTHTQSCGILNPLGCCKSGQGQACWFEFCLRGGPVMALEICFETETPKQAEEAWKSSVFMLPCIFRTIPSQFVTSLGRSGHNFSLSVLFFSSNLNERNVVLTEMSSSLPLVCHTGRMFFHAKQSSKRAGIWF